MRSNAHVFFLFSARSRNLLAFLRKNTAKCDALRSVTDRSGYAPSRPACLSCVFLVKAWQKPLSNHSQFPRLFSACHFASFDFLTKPFYENAILEKSLLAFSVAVVYRVRKRRGTRRGSFLVPSPSFIQSRNQSLKQEQ